MATAECVRSLRGGLCICVNLRSVGYALAGWLKHVFSAVGIRLHARQVVGQYPSELALRLVVAYMYMAANQLFM